MERKRALKRKQEKVLDKRWYSRFEKIYSSYDILDLMEGDKTNREAQREQFLSGEVRNPTLDYPFIDNEQLQRIEERLLSCKQDVLRFEENEVVRDAYCWRINEMVAEVRMAQAIKKGDMRRFHRYSQYIHGKPSQKIFVYTIQRLRDRIQKEAAESSSDEVRNAADVLLQSLPVVDPQTHSDLPVPSTELANRVGKNIATEIRSIARIEDGEKKLNASEIRQAFEQAIQKLQLPGWQVIIDQGSSTRIRVSQKDKAVQIPASTNILAKELLPLIGHELKTHVGRRVNGKRSKLHLLALGLDRYLPGEEGIATFHEQALEEQVNDFDGFDGHFAISLAQGLDGKKKDFRDTFEILQKYYLFDQLSKGKSQEEATTEANKLAYNRCIRTFRGSDCNTPGAVYTKDIVYREGNIGVWRVISTNEKEMVRFSVGKYDPANGRHVYMLDQVGINAADLETLAA